MNSMTKKSAIERIRSDDLFVWQVNILPLYDKVIGNRRDLSIHTNYYSIDFVRFAEFTEFLLQLGKTPLGW